MLSLFDDYCSAWLEHSKTDAFRRKVSQSIRYAWEAHGKGTLYGSLSGGKDSAVLAGLLTECEIDVQWCHATSSLNLPDTLQTVDAIAEHLDLAYDIIEPDKDILHELKHLQIADGKDWLECLGDFLNRYSSAALLVQYSYTHSFDGHYDGVRADESKSRTMYARKYGTLHQRKDDGRFTARPLLWWTAEDVYAYAVSRGIPLHPIYRAAVDQLGMDPYRVRVDWLFAPSRASLHHGACYAVRMLYTDTWRRLLQVRPELSQYE